MGDALLVLIVAIFLIGSFAGYDSRFQKRGFVIKKRFWRFLIWNDGFFEKSKKRPKKDRNKISLAGIIYYIASGITALVKIVLAILPDIPIAPVTIETDEETIRVNTFNQLFSYKLNWWLLCSVFFYIGFCLLRSAKFEEKRWMRILTIIGAVVVMLACVCAVFIL